MPLRSLRGWCPGYQCPKPPSLSATLVLPQQPRCYLKSVKAAAYGDTELVSNPPGRGLVNLESGRIIICCRRRESRGGCANWVNLHSFEPQGTESLAGFMFGVVDRSGPRSMARRGR
jgi:hypothetical protein